MKRKALLLLVVTICLCNGVMAQNESESLLREERVWTMSYSSIYQKDQVSCIESKLEGDTIIGNICFKRKYNREWKQNEGGSREWKATDYYVGQIGGKVYYYYKALYEEPQLLLDFSAKVGDDIPYNVDGRPGSLDVVNVSDTVLTCSTDQRLMRCVYVRDVDNGVSDVWIEGIGSLEYGIEPYFMNRITGAIPKLLRCTEGHNVLYDTVSNYHPENHDELSANDVNIDPGKTAKLEIGLKNANEYYCALFDLKLPEGITIAKDDEGNYAVELSRWSNKHFAGVEPIEGGYRIGIITAYNEKYIAPGEGTMATITLQASDDAKSGIGKIIADGEANGSKTQSFFTEYGGPYYPKDVEFKVNVKEEAYRPFVEDGKVWAVRGIGISPDDNPMEQWIDYCYLDGDTIIGGQTCKRMMYIKNDNPSPLYIGAWYEQDKKVYFAGNDILRPDMYAYYSGGDNRPQFELLYDFTLSSGDNIQTPFNILWTVNKKSGGITGFKGTYYDLIYNDKVVEHWFEGVGSDSWPFYSHPRWIVGNVGGVLLECFVGDEVIYYNSEEDDPYSMGARKKRFDFTHTIKTKPKAPIQRETSDACISSSEREVARPKVKARKRTSAEAEQSLYGEYNDMQLGINLDPLDDDYQVRITDETGKVVYDKAVNAGNIVGLNIDISTYAKGRYTVTVENSKETFTGEFDAQTTGIEEVKSEQKDVRNKIYNLQGQRLNTLQKGLNIVNGRKVYVK